MKFFTTVRKRKRGTRLVWTARLVYEDQITGKRKELSKSAPSKWEAMLLKGELRKEFMAGGQAMESRDMTFAQLARHFQDAEGCKALYDEMRTLSGTDFDWAGSRNKASHSSPVICVTVPSL